MDEEKKKKNFWGKEIKTEEDAIKTIKDVSNGVFLVAALQIVIGFFFLPAAVLDGLVLGVLAFLLRKFKNRAVAIILFLFSILALVVTGINNFGGGTGGKNIILTIILIIISIQAIRATFKLKELKTLNPPLV